MLKNLKINIAALITAGVGLVGLGLLALLYTTCMDEKGLLVSGHPLLWVLGLLTVAAMLLIFLYCRASQGSDRFAECFPKSLPGAIGSFVAAAGALVVTLTELGQDLTLPGIACTVLGFLAVVSFCVTGLCRSKGQRPLSVYHGAISLYFALRLVCHYRTWSANPQLTDNLFCILASVCLMLTAYHRAAFDAGIGKRRSFLFFSLLALLLSVMALLGEDSCWLYLCGGIWALTGILEVPKKEAKDVPA